MGWNEEHTIFTIDEFGWKESMREVLKQVRDGDTRPLQMYSDEDMRECLSADDYDFWLSEKNRFELERKNSMR